MERLDVDSYLYDIEFGGLNKLQEVADYVMGSPYVVSQVIGGINTNISQLKKILNDSDGFKNLEPNEAQIKIITKLMNKTEHNFLVVKSYITNSNLNTESERQCNECIFRFEVAMLGLSTSLNRKGISLDLKKSKTITLPTLGEAYYIENWSPERGAELKSLEDKKLYIENPSNINDYIENIINLIDSLEKNSPFPPGSVGNLLLEDIKNNSTNIKDRLEIFTEEDSYRTQGQIISQLMDRIQNKFTLAQKQMSYQSLDSRDANVQIDISKLQTNIMDLAKALKKKGVNLDLDNFTPRFIPEANQTSSEDLGKWSSKAKYEQSKVSQSHRNRE